MEYLSDLGIEPEDLKSLVLAYFLQSPSMGVFPRASFLSQWHKYKISSIKDMKTFIGTYFRNVINGQDDPKSFQKLYNFTFGFLLENENQKLLDYELVIEYWKLLLPLAFINNPQQGKFNKRLDQWYDFLGNEYKRPFSKDMWSMFYLFVEEVIFVDPVGFKEYDEMAAWPSVMDEYVEYLTEGELLEQRT